MYRKPLFKKFVKFQENFLNSPKFTAKVFSNFSKGRWVSFKKSSSPISRNFIKISTFFFLKIRDREKDKLCFFLKSQPNSLVSSLVLAHFSRGYGEASFIIKSGKVTVNSKKVTNKFFILSPSDVINFVDIYAQVLASSFFFTRFKGVTTFYKFPNNLEISFSGGFFIFCY